MSDTKFLRIINCLGKKSNQISLTLIKVVTLQTVLSLTITIFLKTCSIIGYHFEYSFNDFIKNCQLITVTIDLFIITI